MEVAKNVHSLTHTFPAEVEQGDTLPFCSISHTVNKCLFVVHLVPHFCVSFLVILLFQKAPRSSAKCCPVCLPLRRKHVPDELGSHMTYSVVGCEFNINESTMNIQ